MFGIFKNKKQQIVTRIAPSPTGNLHIGTARTALFNYLFARKYGGKFILRVEDTDKERSTKEFETNILEGMDWLNLCHDEIYRQSERTEIYEKYIKDLVDTNKAYVSKEEPKDEGSRSEVIRFRNPNKIISFNDEIRGEIEFKTEELGDFVLAKSFTEPLYHLAVVVDDYEMGVTHVIRGEDGISNTPRQILIQEAIGAPRPVYVHLPLILGKDKSKMSKRDGATSILDYREKGYIKEAIINHLAMLGWNPGTDQEIFSLDELVESFSLNQIQKGGAIFNTEKLDWFNKEYLKLLSDDDFCHCVSEKLMKLNFDGETILKLKPVILDRIVKISDIDEMIKNGELDYFDEQPEYDKEKLSWKDTGLEEAVKHLEKVKEIISEMDKDNFTQAQIKESIWPYANEEGRGDVLWPLRYSLSGRDRSPDPFEISGILGKEKTLNRINHALKISKK
ncbi:MAG: glutamyl-tRNA synthetase [Candidatus Paceibacteria bacterium]|jgi:glutamyl-tRNA synthetase